MQLGALKAPQPAGPGRAKPSTPPSSPCGWSKPTAATPGPRRLDAGTVSGVCSATCWKTGAASAGQRAARLPDRHAHRPPRDAQVLDASRPGPEAEAAQPFTRATGCITAARPLGGCRRRLPAPAHRGAEPAPRWCCG
ncbi:hypothetical protein I553_3880 [Mycobacterium xenopi 4042]|uniref:Uncharacterized protein n=1 Tax=Mycobacterium xenopi 4042 TaxID=1299334 RepID=X8EFA6_MYCXE|nr:hypothetical protein I553_3880 [Mycobacterium xenopi 4042]